MTLKTARFILFLAALYNLTWGALISLFPEMIFYGDAPSLFTLIIIQCIGMLVGVYGIGYYFASRNPVKYWPMILVGLIGKVLGPIGAVYYIFTKGLSTEFLIVNFFNDFIWMIPFTMILIAVYKGSYEVTTAKEDDTKSLYEKILGNDYEKLSPNLRHFHRLKTPERMLGHFKVERGETWLTKFIGDLIGLPPASNSEQVELNVIPQDGKETWIRRIGTKTTSSLQWKSEHYLVEKLGAMKVYFAVKVENGDLIIYDAHSSMFGIPMPSFFSPQIYTVGHDTDDGMLTDVSISFYPFGKVMRYSGVVKKVAQ